MSKIVVANWKMNPPSVKEVENLLKNIKKFSKNLKNLKITICPPFAFLFLFKKLGKSPIALGAQNVSSEDMGPYTGEISPKMLFNMGVRQVIVGHSECRARGETNELINKKILNLLKHKIRPIICVGESKRDNEGFYLSFISEQIKECLKGIPRAQLKNIIIAYEPIWAIGKGAKREATKEEFIEIKIFIKKVFSDLYGVKFAHLIPIIYGGSVHEDNANSFIKEASADGLLIGRDSLIPKKFEAILKSIR